MGLVLMKGGDGLVDAAEVDEGRGQIVAVHGSVRAQDGGSLPDTSGTGQQYGDEPRRV
ncbi:hypothetical protein GCM10010300_82550 [Streptomyces olivaceoviridis]|uniref:hypothetical protein n=1 Tax=Streptomyces olivaceoviridis TaxID=1921 RepID=UPI001677D7C7|nr:hypothetical protein [Streptomyces olivaceoviridis]GGZ26718.1 hypothetical protein GCM10010300_82550 [Streptomyces olivaceoviridis]